jgi:hypothetical protein
MIQRVPGTLMQLVRLRGGPQDLPAAWWLTALLFLLNVTPGVLSSRVLEEADGLPRALVASGFQVVAAGLLLQLKGLGARMPQTLSALCGTGFLFGSMVVVLLLGLEPEGPGPLQVLVYWILFFWSLAVDAHIYRHALSIKMQTGALIAVLIFAGNFVLLRTLFG